MKKVIKKYFLPILTMLSMFWIIWLSLTPIIDRDATRFHLPFAKIWAENGFLYFRKWFAYYDLNMLNLNYLYMLVFKFGLPDQFTKIIHASFLLAGGYLIFNYFKNKYGFNWGLLSVIMYVTLPIHQRLASEVYVDLGLLFFSTFSIIYFVKWFESGLEKRKYLVLSALGTGLAFGTKYNAMIFAFFLTLFVGLVTAREKKDDKLALKNILLYSAIITLCASPWLLRNFIDSGNPFFPLFNSLIPSKIPMPEDISVNVTYETAWRFVAENENFFSLFLLPLRVFFEGADHDFLKFDGVLNPFMILLIIPLFILKARNSKEMSLIKYLLFIFIALYLTTLYANNIRIRYFIPAYQILIFVNTESLKKLYSYKRFKYLFYFTILAVLGFNVHYGIKYFSDYDLIHLNPFNYNSREIFLSKYLRNYETINYINKNTAENSVIYEAFTGGRSYYINREFYSDTYPLDRYLLKLAYNGADQEDYEKHFQDLPNSNLSATHLLIRANNFIETFYEINYDENDPDNIQNTKKLRGYLEFLNGLKLLFENDGVYLFELHSQTYKIEQ